MRYLPSLCNRVRDPGSISVAKLTAQLAEQERLWVPSCERAYLRTILKDYILPNEQICIDPALCLGLGPPSKDRLSPLEFPYLPSLEDDRNPSVTRDNLPKNCNLFQLLFFETILEELSSFAKLLRYLTRLTHLTEILQEQNLQSPRHTFRIHFFKM